MTTAQLKLPPMMAVADFLDWPGDGTATRYELVDGVLRAMSPGSDAHNTIVATFGFLLASHLKRTRPGCRVVTAPGIQPRVRAEWNFRIPDLGVTCAPNRSGEVMTPSPVLLVEVLSPGNAQDTYENVRAYATLPSVQEIVVIHSTRMRVELLRRGDGGDWPSDPTTLEAADALELASIEARFPIAEIYTGTHLATTANPTE